LSCRPADDRARWQQFPCALSTRPAASGRHEGAVREPPVRRPGMCTQVPTPLSGGSLRSGEAWRTRQVRRLSAREAKPRSGGGAGRRPAPGESRDIATGTRAMSRLWAGLIALTAASRLSPMPTPEGAGLASPHPQARAHTLVSRDDRASRPGAPDNPLQHSIQSGSDQTKAGRRLRHEGGRRDEREGDAISHMHNRHQGIQHRSSNLDPLRC